MKREIQKPARTFKKAERYLKKSPYSSFDSVHIKLASPETILEWSSGEVIKTETINYRTQNMERGGLFCEKIFGPSVDMQCGCGKYKGSQYKGIACERCEVTVSSSDVRRERMGHIELATPVAHIWFLKKTPSRIAMLLGIKMSDIQKVANFTASIVISVDVKKQKEILDTLNKEYKEQYATLQNEKTKKELNKIFDERHAEVKSVSAYAILLDEQVYTLQKRYPPFFVAEKGSEPLYNLLEQMNLKTMEKTLLKEYEKATKIQRVKIQKRLSVVRSMIHAEVRPEWMFVKNLPVIPPDLRPLIMLEGGRYASSDINDLYRTIIIRNNRLKQMKEKYNAPEIILQNEKRLLQEAVDALIDASIKKSSMRKIDKNAKKSIAEHMKSKSGHFRQHLLGKRVDFSARSVITVGPSLRFNQCGIPQDIALEIFKPFVVAQILKKELAHTLRQGMRMIEEVDVYPEIWDILEEIIKEKVVLLIRQPTLHRQNILAFQPILVSGKAIQIHPLVCKGYNADFDGDQMSVYLPLSDEAQEEAKILMLSSFHTINSGDGEISAAPNTQDIIFGSFWATTIEENAKGTGKVFADFKDVHVAYIRDIIDLRAEIVVKKPNEKKFQDIEGEYIHTTVGRYLFNEALPNKMRYWNSECDKSDMQNISKEINEIVEKEKIGNYFDRIKEFGFKFAYISGISVAWNDYPEKLYKEKEINEAKEKNKKIIEQHEDGLLSDTEKGRKIIEVWKGFVSEMNNKSLDALDKESSLRYIVQSGAKGGTSDIVQTSGALGIVTTASGVHMNVPILSSYKRGLSPISIFKQSFGARKGVAAGKLDVRVSGYLSRRLYDVLQDFSVREVDCGTKKGFTLDKESQNSKMSSPLIKKIIGRNASKDVVDKNGKVVVKRNEKMTRKIAESIVENKNIEEISIRSPITCTTVNGVCQKCYGEDVSNRDPASLGLGVGAIAATSIGEPGTQLNLRVFHTGGVSVGADVAEGLKRIVELVDNIKPIAKSVLSSIDGRVVSITQETNGREVTKTITLIPSGDKKVKETDTIYHIAEGRLPLVAEGDEVKIGDAFCDGSIDLNEMDVISGKGAVQRYIMSEMDFVLGLQGIQLRSIHLEVLVRRIYGLYEVVSSGSSKYSEGDLLDEGSIRTLKKKIKDKEEEPIKVKNVLKGIKQVALNREGFLSSASFERTAEVLIRSSLSGTIDPLEGGKENNIVGKLIPFGTGFEKNPFSKKMKEITMHNQQIVEDIRIAKQKEREERELEM